MTIKQNTLVREFSLSGKGLHTGVQVNMTFKPAPENHGIKFQRVDLENQPILEADANLVIDTSRGTVIGKGDARLSTIEHAMAALTGMDLDNVLIEIDNEEVPILDGSSKPFVEAIEKIGVEEQNAEREYFEITEKIVYKDPETGAEIIALPAPIGPGSGHPIEDLRGLGLAVGLRTAFGGLAPKPLGYIVFLDRLQIGLRRDAGLAEIFLRQHVRCDLGPCGRHFDSVFAEDD